MANPNLLILVCGLVSSGLGILYLTLAGAPLIYLFANFGAVLIGLLLAGLRVVPLLRERVSEPEFWVLTFAAILMLTGLLGSDVDGIKRWIAIGPIQIQPGLILVPLMTLLYARNASPWTGLGICLAALALALQPDRATAGAFCAAVLGLLTYRRDPITLTCAFIASLSFVATLLRPDGLPAVEFVEGVYQAAIVSGGDDLLIVALGTALLLAPAGLFRAAPVTLAPVYFTFGIVWLSMIIAAYLGNYPTPLLGYGTSSILGYLLCIYAFPGPASKARRAQLP